MLWELDRRQEARSISRPSELHLNVPLEFLLSLRSKGCGLGLCLGKLGGQACSPALLGLGEAGMWVSEAGSFITRVCRLGKCGAKCWCLPQVYHLYPSASPRLPGEVASPGLRALAGSVALQDPRASFVRCS